MASRTMTEHISVVLRPPVSGNLLRQPWKVSLAVVESLPWSMGTRGPAWVLISEAREWLVGRRKPEGPSSMGGTEAGRQALNCLCSLFPSEY